MREPDMSKPHKGTFINWEIYSRDSWKGQTDHLGFILFGTFHGHPQFGGTRGHTSAIVAVFPDLNMVETLNSRYTLEQPAICESKELMQYV